MLVFQTFVLKGINRNKPNLLIWGSQKVHGLLLRNGNVQIEARSDRKGELWVDVKLFDAVNVFF